MSDLIRVEMKPVAGAVASVIGYTLPVIYGSIQFYLDEGLLTGTQHAAHALGHRRV